MATFCRQFWTTIAYSREKNCHRFKSLDDRRHEEDPKGKIVVITGANDGIGKMTALQMAKREAIVVMGCRDLVKAEEAAKEIKQQHPSAQLHVIKLDLGSLESVREFAGEVNTRFPCVNILINNAGIMLSRPTLGRTVDGFEMQMGVNYMGHVLLTLLLLESLKKGAPSRVVFVSSLMHKNASLKLDDLNCEKVKSLGYLNHLPYCNSKLATILYAKGLAKRLEGTGVHVYSLCPGIVKTHLQTKGSQKRACHCLLRCLADISIEKGTETTMYCSLSTKCAEESGLMYHFGHRWKTKIVRKTKDDFIQSLMTITEDLIGYQPGSEKPKERPSSQIKEATQDTTALPEESS